MLQTFATVFYVVFAVVLYLYVGPTVASPAFTSLPDKWQKASYAIALPNFLIAGSLYSHTAAKLLFVRFFRKSRHLYSHTLLGWSVWILLVFVVSASRRRASHNVYPEHTDLFYPPYLSCKSIIYLEEALLTLKDECCGVRARLVLFGVILPYCDQT